MRMTATAVRTSTPVALVDHPPPLKEAAGRRFDAGGRDWLPFGGHAASRFRFAASVLSRCFPPNDFPRFQAGLRIAVAAALALLGRATAQPTCCDIDPAQA